MNDRVIIRQAHETEHKILTDLALRSKAHWGYSKEFMTAVREELTVRPTYIARSPVVVAESDGVIYGFAGLSTPADKAHPELTFIFVEPSRIGSGIGKLLWNAIVDEAKQSGLNSFKILSDPGAEPFYVRMGARKIGEAPSSIRMLPLLEYKLNGS